MENKTYTLSLTKTGNSSVCSSWKGSCILLCVQLVLKDHVVSFNLQSDIYTYIYIYIYLWQTREEQKQHVLP